MTVDVATAPGGRTTSLLHEVAAGHAADRVAVRFSGRTTEELTYGELDRRSNRLAQALRRAEIGPGAIVGLLLDRGLDLPIAQLAVNKAGAAWTVLDPQHPPARLAFQTSDAAMPLVLTTTDLAERAPPDTPNWRLDDRDDPGPDSPPDVDVGPDDAAYLLYTSGSTGTPKGVLVSHRSAFTHCRNAVHMFATTSADRVAQVANPAFDMSVFDCYATLLAGATLISAPNDAITDPDALTTLLRDERVTLAAIPPALLALLDPHRLVDSALRALDIGGEALSADLVNRWSRPTLALHNGYGPTEATVICIDYLLPATHQHGRPPIGTPLPHHRAYVLNRRLQPVPIGVPGQLFVAGCGVAHGYLNRSALTALSFLPDPYGPPGERMYATGDLARWRSDGVLEYLGRTDRQVKIRGQRIELGEIEHALLQHPDIRQSVVVLRDDSYLVAYLVGDVDAREVRKHLADRLPTYMIPTAFVTLPELPLTRNGKLDTARLPEPSPSTAEYRPPHTDTERWLADTWRDLLGAERIGTGDTFFDLGANSLHTTQLTARIRDHFSVQLHPRHLFADPTLEQLATRLDEARTDPADGPADDELDGEIAALERLLAQKRAAKAQRARSPGTRPVSRDGTLACTLQQEGLWFVQQLDPSSSVYHIGFGLRLHGVLDRGALERALHALLLRHEALRTRFLAEDGVPRQVVDPPPSAAGLLSIVDLDADDAQRWVADQIGRPLDLAAGPLFRAALARIAPDEHVLALVVHHIVADGWSVGILAGELSQLYAAAVNGTHTALPDLPTRQADHAIWQRGWLSGAELDRQLGYWRTKLADLSTVAFPVDRPRPARPTGAGANVQRRLPDGLATAARAYARAHQVSFLAVAHAALLTVLHRYTGQTDLPVGSIFSGRTRAEIEPVVGFFANTLVLRTDVGGNPTFTDLVQRCNHTVFDATVHQDVPFGLVVDALQPERIAGRNPLFQISLTYQPGRGGGGNGELTLGGLTAEPVDGGTRYARFDLAIELAEARDGRLDLTVEYSTELFDADRVDRLLDHVAAVLTAGLAAPDTAVADIDILSCSERDRVLRAWNPSPVHRAAGLLHQVTAGHDPDSVAVRFRGAHLTYAELERRSNRLANALHDCGIGTGDIVALLLDRGMHLPVAQLAVMKSGAAWTLLDLQLPATRLAFQATDAATPLVLTTSDLTRLAPPNTPYWALDDLDRPGPDDTPPDVEIRPDDPAYLLYTSGSTGTPKGVLVSHRSAYSYCHNAVEQFHTTAADRVAQTSNPAFDAHIFDTYPSLLAGATLIGAPRETIADPAAFTDLIRAERVTLSFIPPAVLAILDPDDFTDSALRAIACGGEALPAAQVNRWSRPGLELHNPYGPTETTVVVTDYVCSTTPVTAPPPIGTPLPQHRAYVLDQQLRPAPIGVAGQLHIAGTGVSYGYLNRPALTARRFLADPYGAPGERMYATGDLARWRSDGVLEYLGRTDRQVKIRGQRIELGEIEHALLQHPDIRQSVVVLRDTTLAGYVVGDADLDDVRHFLADRLPTYMIPTALVALAELPITPNGKLDTAGLPEPVPSATDYVEPGTDTERWLATVWQGLLEVDRVGATDNFFDLGGNSLHATQLVARIRDRVGVTLPPQVLFADPTLGRLAARIDRTGDEGTAAPADTGVIALHQATRRPPLFLVHPSGGSVTAYARLAQMLGDDQPVHAIEDPAVRGTEPAGDLAAQARQYLELIRRMRPDGPYHLGGWSLGGVIALEMARQLADAGARVGAVVLLDPGLPPDPCTPDDLTVLSSFVRDLAGLAGAAPPDVDLDTFRGRDREVLEELALDVLDKAGLVPSALRDELRLRMRAFAANVRALYAHRPRRYDGPVTLIRTRVDSADTDYATWDELCPRLERRTVPGDHYTMMRPPHLAALAAAVGDALRGAATGSCDKTPAGPGS